VPFSIGGGVVHSAHMSAEKATTLKEVGEMLTHELLPAMTHLKIRIITTARSPHHGCCYRSAKLAELSLSPLRGGAPYDLPDGIAVTRSHQVTLLDAPLP
jgi:hypothetical protein